ncbi:hypothetical protein AMS68_000658 [Peltaster fructicola]|uniref:Chromosome segregation in meiosis protein n=1 Tax=Peltaster fructicola TaxID=286661 RepID=A0A6H0XKI1_9PEZI|nr:hypothetical protein AMS68_000658 [Peltaster fructicola]
MVAAQLSSHQGPLDTNNYDDDVADFRRELELDELETVNNPNYYPEPARNIDEEIKITKKRKPVAKLDAERLLSESGIPELRRRATKRIKLRGKGNEFEDIGGLLQMYQMWLDDLYPKAKFRDGLAMIEKVGHTKRLNVMRRAWITSTRPGQAAKPDEDPEYNSADPEVEIDAEIFPKNSEAAPDADSAEVESEDDLDALLAQESATNKPRSTRTNAHPFGEDESDQDDLDALLEAEASAAADKQLKTADQQQQSDAQDKYADEEEAMHEMGIWQQANSMHDSCGC